jgi:hypothetical protein
MIPLHCFYCDNIDSRIVALHQEAAVLAGIEIHYSQMPMRQLEEAGISPHAAHGLFIENLLLNFPDNLVGIIDIDCVLSSQSFLLLCENKVQKSGTIIGLAQSANHLPSRDQIYAAPAFMVINGKAWHALDKPSLVADGQFDTAQRLTHELIQRNMPVDIVMPDCHSNTGPVWPLADKGTFGIGTFYGEKQAFHLFQSSKGPSYVELLEACVAKLRQGAQTFE